MFPGFLEGDRHFETNCCCWAMGALPGGPNALGLLYRAKLKLGEPVSNHGLNSLQSSIFPSPLIFHPGRLISSFFFFHVCTRNMPWPWRMFILMKKDLLGGGKPDV